MSTANFTLQKFLARHSLAITILIVIIGSLSCKTEPDRTSDADSITGIINSAYVMAHHNLDSAILLFDQAIMEATAIKHDSLIVIALMNKAINKSQQGDINYADSIHNLLIYDGLFDVDSSLLNKVKLSYAHLNIEWGDKTKALKLCKEATAYYESIHYEKAIIASNLFISSVYIQLLDYKNAMSALVKALDRSEKIDQKAFIAMAYNNMGDLYFKEHQYKKSIDCYKLSAENFSIVNYRANVAACFQSIGSSYIELDDIVNAEESLNKSAEMYSEIGMYSNVMRNLNNLGTAYKNKKQHNKALECYNKALELNKKTNIPAVTADAYTNMGNVYYNLKNYTNAKHYYTKSHDLRLKSGDTDFRVFYFNMMNVNAAEREWQKAYNWARKYESHSDSIFNIEKYETTEELRTKYEAEKKDLQLETMHAEKERDQLTILKNRISIIGLSFILLLIITFAYFFIKQYHEKVQSYKDLIKKNEEISIINTEKREKALTSETTPNIKSTNTNSDKISISEELVESIKHRLHELINSKFYTSTSLSLNQAADMLETNTRYLSQIINDTFGCNFPTFINQLRIEEAQRLLKDPQSDNFTIEVLGQNAGFKSKSAFNTAFKKETGVTPSFYKKNLREEQN